MQQETRASYDNHVGCSCQITPPKEQHLRQKGNTAAKRATPPPEVPHQKGTKEPVPTGPVCLRCISHQKATPWAHKSLRPSTTSDHFVVVASDIFHKPNRGNPSIPLQIYFTNRIEAILRSRLKFISQAESRQSFDPA